MRRLICALALAALAGCASRQVAEAPPSPPAAVQPFDVAIADLTDALLARVDQPAGTRRPIVIDPLIDHGTGYQTAATRSVSSVMERRIREKWPQFELQPFGTASLGAQPLVLLGSIAGAPGPGSVEVVVDHPPVYRIWGVVADLRTDKVIERRMAWVSAAEVDQTPIAFFRDAPVWSPDPMDAAYITTCSSTAGTALDPQYVRGLQAEAVIADATNDYGAGRYRNALALYEQALAVPAGEQLRVLNGIYLADWALGRRDEAASDFRRVVDFGLNRGTLGVKFLFRPDSTAFWPDPAISGAYPMWIREIAAAADEKAACLALTGHASPTGSAALNDRLSLARAETVRRRLVSDQPDMAARTRASGDGARDPIVGNGRDDGSDVLDRRVDVRPAPAGDCRT